MQKVRSNKKHILLTLFIMIFMASVVANAAVKGSADAQVESIINARVAEADSADVTYETEKQSADIQVSMWGISGELSADEEEKLADIKKSLTYTTVSAFSSLVGIALYFI